ncbi:signal peptidase II [Winogradskyella epiphytica]|uniref:Lipoprotein signal peptidase n=1 Tax=Winogradskyella epiphytica TaxID=262005 RepID=A0A2V4XDY0_9FLAO|nr:signal peptidase II [Winogradskyella epiphytica]PYE80674.1 signal peptidase II [Winogradskyella epiphytica]GGW67638.1 lipoprotein signal peptidase [Winogradskyella epiphytica]
MNRTLFITLLIVFNIAIDQISKVIVRNTLNFREEIDVIGKYFQLIWVENKGAFLGMGSDMNPTLRFIFLLVLPTVVLAYVIYYILKTKELDRLSLIAFCCIAGGGIANVFDRIVFGQVTDFFFINLGGVFKTGIFNIADMSVTAGMIMLLFSGIFNSNKKEEIA